MSLKKTFAIALITIVSLSQGGIAGVLSVADSNVRPTTGVTISGRVKSTNDRPIAGATIQLKDSETNEVVRSAISSTFGQYKIENVDSSRSYVLSVTHKRYIFVLPAHLLEFAEDRTNMDFIGEASE